MGKAIKPSKSSAHTFPRKGVSKNTKVPKLVKKPDIIGNYLRTLSSNFGLHNVKKTFTSDNRKRKTEESNDEELPPIIPKKMKILEKIGPTDETIKSCSKTVYSDTQFEYKTKCLHSEDEIRDLFYMDEIKSSNEHTFYTDWLFHICDEISLEGLEGITVEGLWSRLEDMSPYPVLLEGKEELIWYFIKHINQLEYHILEAPRGKIIIYDRNTNVCPDSGIVLEPVVNYDDIYPYTMVNKDGIKGSCSTYSSRMENTDIVKNLTLAEASNIYGQRLVIVASQSMRGSAIISEISNPNLELVDNEYGLLERVGRSRKYGELTQGKVSILNMIKDSRSIFHIRKSLENKKILKKQFFILRSLTASQNKTGKLLQLPRFYRKQKSKTLLLIEEVVELLRKKPGYSLEFGEFKRYFPRSTGVNKVMKMPEFGKYIRTDIFRPYRYLYPNATATEWKYRNKDKEKKLRIFQLIDPTINVSACWDAPDVEHNSDDECIEDELPGNKLINPEFLKEVFMFIFNKGKEGVTLQEIEKKIQLDYYTIRIAIRKLQAKNVIDSLRSEHGKQRHIFYFARCFHSETARPMPVSKALALPENILQKILQPQVSSTTRIFKEDSSLLINEAKCLKNLLASRSLWCRAFELKMEILPQKMITSELNSIMKTSSEDVYSIDLISEPIDFKFFKSLKTVRRKRWNWAKQNNIIISYCSDDLTMKLVLLRSVMFGGKSKIMDMIEGGNGSGDEFRQNAVIDFEALQSDRRSIAFKVSQNFSRDYLLGPSPMIIHEEITTENINVTVILSTPPKEYIFDYTSYNTLDKNLTALSLFRTNTILELVNQSQIICDIYKLQKSMMEIEMSGPDIKPGQGKIDKNTLNRILLKLVTGGYIRIFKLLLSTDEKFKVQWLITHPRIDLNHASLKAAQEQMVLKFFLGLDKGQALATAVGSTAEKVPSASPFDSLEVSSNQLREISSTQPKQSYKLNRQFGRLLGYQPKFVRLQLLHEILFYLIYDYQPLERMNHHDIEEVLIHYAPEEFREIPPIYKKGIDWKMFIPPLPSHKEYNCGWALLCDVILSIPLSLWVKLFHTSLECPELLTYMDHPIRRHYLIKDVPLEFRYVIMFRRKYLLNAIELLYRLCFIGLVQLGPQSPQVKDQIFLFLNRNATLFDTSTSAPSYHKVSPMEYKKIQFKFSSKADVEEYWCHLWTLSMNTPLGQRTVMEGKSVTIENPAYKSVLLDALKSKTPAEALLNDTGEIPGDKKGAAGLDSSMWSHIKRNWLWSTKCTKQYPQPKKDDPIGMNIRNANIACIEPVSIKYRELMNQSRKIFLPNEHNEYEDFSSGEVPKISDKAKVHRKISLKKISKKKQVLDSKDKSILKKVSRTFRARWTQKEDRILIICKAASYLLSSKSNKELISFNVVRDVLHALSPLSKDKTSATCTRRIVKLWKVDPVMKRIKDNSNNFINLTEISKYFSPIIFNMNKLTSSKCPYNSIEVNVAYAHLVFYMYKNLLKIERILQGKIITLDYFSVDNMNTFDSILVDVDRKKNPYINAMTENDVEKGVIQSVLLSSLNSSKLGQNTSYQLFKICTKYPDNLIRSSVLTLKNYQAISLNKKSKSLKEGLRTMPFQLSISYIYMQKSTFTTLTMLTVYQNHLEIIGKPAKFAEVDPSNTVFRYGRLLARNEIVTIWPSILYTFNIPDSAFILNPYMEDRSKLTTELALLYQQYLKQQLQDRMKQDLNESTQTTISDKGESAVAPTEKKGRFELTRLNITRLLMSLPCFCNKKITDHFTLFMESVNEDVFNNCLSIFLEALITVSLNLLNTEPDAFGVLQLYIQKFRKNKLIDSETKELEVRLYKVVFIIREFLKNHQLTNIKECFEKECVNRNVTCEETIRVWLAKSKMKSQKATPKMQVQTTEDSAVCHSFFKYNKNKVESKNESVMNSHTEMPDDIPEVDEIVKGMMVPPNSKISTNIPHISELACLLSKDKFPESNKDEKFLEELKGHFITQYPILEGFKVNDIEDLKQSPLLKELLDTKKKDKLKQIKNFLIQDPTVSDITEIIQAAGGGTPDISLTQSIIKCVHNRGVLGATGKQLKMMFDSKTKHLDLVKILTILTENFILLRTGIAEIVFVHNEFTHKWLVETFHLSPQENHMLNASGGDQLYKLQQKIESRIKSTKQKKVLLMPWIRIDGTLNLPLFEKWLTLVLSYCLDFPNCPLFQIFDKYYLMKPVEVYYLLEVLQDLNCLKMRVNVKSHISLSSVQLKTISRPATVLDNFEDMYVEVHTLSTTCMGFYLDKEFVEFA